MYICSGQTYQDRTLYVYTCLLLLADFSRHQIGCSAIRWAFVRISNMCVVNSCSVFSRKTSLGDSLDISSGELPVLGTLFDAL